MPKTEQLEHELNELPTILEALQTEGIIQLMHIYKKQLDLIQEMYNTTSHAARKAVINEQLKLEREESQ